MKLTNHSIKLSVVIIFILLLSTVSLGLIPKVSATISIDFNFDEFSDLPGLDLLRGPQGEQGPQGETGQPGTPADEKELSIRTVEGDVVQNGASGGEHRKSVASCDSDEVLTGGGFKHTGNANYIMDFSRPNGNSWEAQGSPMSQDPSYTQAYAQCQKLTPSS